MVLKGMHQKVLKRTSTTRLFDRAGQDAPRREGRGQRQERLVPWGFCVPAFEQGPCLTSAAGLHASALESSWTSALAPSSSSLG